MWWTIKFQSNDSSCCSAPRLVHHGGFVSDSSASAFSSPSTMLCSAGNLCACIFDTVSTSRQLSIARLVKSCQTLLLRAPRWLFTGETARTFPSSPNTEMCRLICACYRRGVLSALVVVPAIPSRFLTYLPSLVARRSMCLSSLAHWQVTQTRVAAPDCSLDAW